MWPSRRCFLSIKLWFLFREFSNSLASLQHERRRVRESERKRKREREADRATTEANSNGIEVKDSVHQSNGKSFSLVCTRIGFYLVGNLQLIGHKKIRKVENRLKNSLGPAAEASYRKNFWQSSLFFVKLTVNHLEHLK